MTRVLASLFASCLVLFAACASAPTRADYDSHYVLAYLKTGPLSGSKTEAENQKIFAGHMANIQRLADERKLVIAGPFDKPHDSSWRGIFVLDVATIDEARELVGTDPGVMEQVFVVELCPLSSTRTLRTSLDLEKEMRDAAARAGEAAAPFSVRGYVMITAHDPARAEAALAPLRSEKKVVWSGDLAGSREGQGVFVLDAATVEDAEKLLGDARAKLGDCTIDSWWASKSLAGLATSG
jgi:uncharacterized protein YciI